MGKKTYERLETDEERKQFIIEVLKELREKIVDYKTSIVKWQNKLNIILAKEERQSKNTIVRSKSSGNLTKLFDTRRTRKNFILKR